MSVINKMLRDLDSRQAAGAVPVSTPQLDTGIARDTMIVNDSEPARRRPSWSALTLLIAVSLVLLAAAGGAWWYLNQKVLPRAAPAKPVIAVVPTPRPVPSAPVVAPVPVPQTGFVLADMSLRMDSNLKILPSLEKVVKPNVSRLDAANTLRPLPEVASNDRSRTVTAVKPTATTSATATVVPPSASRQAAVQEALAQAQSLWNSGSRQAAIDFLLEALTAAERANAQGAMTGNKSVLASLARELSSMQLAEGRISQTLELLTRLEPVLSGVAEIWAIRGNAAQRLGRHAESVAAYQMALKLQPNEARWQLGAAVSLAAQGKTAAAAELAEKARAGGALTPELVTYLRQLGVPLR